MTLGFVLSAQPLHPSLLCAWLWVWHFGDVFLLLLLSEDISVAAAAFSGRVLYSRAVLLFLCCHFTPWRGAGGVGGEEFSRNPQVL